jgi:hypothetical protein
MNKSTITLAKTLLTVALICFLGCAGAQFKNYGRLEASNVATDSFERFIISDDYNYFLTGSDVYPLTLFGLNKKYIIAEDNDLLKKIEPTRRMISELVGNMQERLMLCCRQRPQGFDILDGQGNKMGEWYSMFGLIIAIKLKDDGTIAIYPASDTDSIKKYEGRSR